MVDIRRISAHHYDCLDDVRHLGPCTVYAKACIARNKNNKRCKNTADNPYSDMCKKHREKYNG